MAGRGATGEVAGSLNGSGGANGTSRLSGFLSGIPTLVIDGPASIFLILF